MRRSTVWTAAGMLMAILSVSGCQFPYHADQGALLGGLGGAGIGALVGNAVGNTGAGAAIGAGVGALSGAAIGAGMDDAEARNRALIEAQLKRPVRAGSVTISDILTMTQAHVSDELIINHVRAHGMAAPLTANDLIMLQQQGVSPAVVQAMQEPPPSQRETVVVHQPAQPVIVEDYYYARPYYYYGPHYYYYGPPPRPGVRVAFAVR